MGHKGLAGLYLFLSDKVGIIPLTLFVIFLLSFSFLGQKEVTVSSRGEIMPTKVIASIQSTSNNAIVKNNLKENQLVKKENV
ncbi:hypothetical protein KP754_00340 [Streptococcus equi subsp. equi]|nr:hypothetical protein [Streptococcus equi subsp. equi]